VSGEGLSRLHALLRDGGGLIAGLLAPEGPPAHADGLGAHAASGPRAAASPAEYELLVEAIYEGYLLHYGTSRLLRANEADLGLLAGDRLYAIGLERLVSLCDTLAVSELADTITLAALAQSSGDVALGEAVWAAGARAVGWGPSEQHESAKRLVAEGRPEALEAMRTSAAGPPASP
jgi:hypothetical protein